MIWADRLALGLFAFGILFASCAVLNSQTKAKAAVRQAEKAVAQKLEWERDCAHRKQVMTPETEWEYEFICDGEYEVTNVEPKQPISWFELPEMLFYTGAFLIPVWLTLRIVDFIFGGPARRRERQLRKVLTAEVAK